MFLGHPAHVPAKLSFSVIFLKQNISDFSSKPWRNVPPTWLSHMATRRPAHNTPIHVDFLCGFCLKRQEIHVDRRVCGLVCGSPRGSPMWGQISPWPARVVTENNRKSLGHRPVDSCLSRHVSQGQLLSYALFFPEFLPDFTWYFRYFQWAFKWPHWQETRRSIARLKGNGRGFLRSGPGAWSLLSFAAVSSLSVASQTTSLRWAKTRDVKSDTHMSKRKF